MSDQERLAFARLTQYVNRASDLAESVANDIKDSGQVSMKTYEALKAFVKAASRVEKMLEIFGDTHGDLN